MSARRVPRGAAAAATREPAEAFRVEHELVAGAAIGWKGPLRATIVVVVLVTLLGGFWLERLPTVGGDTPQLITGTDWIARCLLDGPRIRCGTLPEGDESMVGPFPLLQYAPDLVLRAFGLTPTERSIGLSVVSVLAFFAMLAVVWQTMSRLRIRGWWPAFLLVILTGPLLYYGNATWGEMLAASILVAFTASTLFPLPYAVVAAAAFLAALTKETAFPFVAAIGLLGLWIARRRTGERVGGRIFAMAAGIALAVAVSTVFNVFRFGSPLNEYYLQPKFQVDSLSTQVEFFVGLLVAPNGGLFLFWLSAVIVLALACTVAVFQRPRTWRSPGLGLALVFLALTASLATWWMPYGWHAWGPRLTIPWIPSLVLLATAAYGERMARPVYRVIRSNAGLVAVVIALSLAALPQVGYLRNSTAVYATFFAPDEYCTVDLTLEALETPEGSRAYYRCVRFRAWEKDSILLAAVRSLRQVPSLMFTAVWVLSLGALLYLMRYELERRRVDAA